MKEFKKAKTKLERITAVHLPNKGSHTLLYRAAYQYEENTLNDKGQGASQNAIIMKKLISFIRSWVNAKLKYH